MIFSSLAIVEGVWYLNTDIIGNTGNADGHLLDLIVASLAFQLKFTLQPPINR
jgi:hypothetical protein